MVRNNHRSSDGAVRGVNGIHLHDHRQSVDKLLTWALDAKESFILLTLISTPLDHSSAIWHETVDHAASVDVDRVDSLVGAWNHHLVQDQLFSAQDDAVFALHSENSAKTELILVWVLTLKFRQLFQRTRPGTACPQARETNTRSQIQFHSFS